MARLATVLCCLALWSAPVRAGTITLAADEWFPYNGTPGAVAEDAFIGHRGTDDDTAAKQLGRGNLTPGGVEFSPGGLTAVWAEENSRPALFAALKRREVYGTRMAAAWTMLGIKEATA